MNSTFTKATELLKIMELLSADDKELSTDQQTVSSDKNKEDPFLSLFKDKYVLIRTYSAGVWAGYLEDKTGEEIILRDARRIYRYWCKKSISLSGVAVYGIDQDRSKICAPLENFMWLKAIEITELPSEIKKQMIDAPIVDQE